jgi:hypothetical protein
MLPLILGGLVLVALIVLLIITTGGSGVQTGTHWANISAIWLAIPMIMGSLILLALLGGLIFLFAKLLKVLPKYGFLAQYYGERGVQIACMISDRVASPVIKVKGVWAGFTAFKNRIRNFF